MDTHTAAMADALPRHLVRQHGAHSPARIIKVLRHECFGHTRRKPAAAERRARLRLVDEQQRLLAWHPSSPLGRGGGRRGVEGGC